MAKRGIEGLHGELQVWTLYRLSKRSQETQEGGSMTSYYATIAIPVEELKREDQYEKRNKWWRVMFPRTAGLKNKRNPFRTTLSMMLREKYRQAKEDLMEIVRCDLYSPQDQQKLDQAFSKGTT